MKVRKSVDTNDMIETPSSKQANKFYEQLIITQLEKGCR